MRLAMLKFSEFFVAVGKARAAAELYRMGYPEYAKALMLKDLPSKK